MKRVDVAVNGAEIHGQDYADYAQAHLEEIKVVAVAETNGQRRRLFQETHKVSESFSFMDTKSLLSKEQLADEVLICTQDQQHYEETMYAFD